ncbi:MAG: 1,5-anhydro-D-fructose reductase [Verrucomicrobia subdivision 3 bacterium]|nr:1,5-anhydro-D-fructose reductase [Limisphaerales bacterium]MCS1413432.1 1,5-anhydro-D-fructose reductase [Limisphaerales bacterium]
MANKKILRVGMIGYRFMGKAHSNGWRQAPHFFPLDADLELRTICGRNPEGVEAAAQELGWKNASTDWKGVVNSPEIDIVDINTPNDSHAEITIAAANAGKHVLCEKPLAMTVDQCKEMLDAAEKNNVVHMVCHNYRRIPAIAHAKKMIEEGAIGDIFHYRARYAQDWIVDPNFPLVWRLQKGVSGSGAHGDINAHIIDLGRYLVGEFTEICGLMNTFIKQRPLEDASGKGDGLSSAGGTEMGEVTVDDAAMFIGRFENGALANLEATRFALGRKNNIVIEINGSKGSLYFDFEDMNRLKYFDNSQPDDRQGFSDILVTQPGGSHPYVAQWWPPGHIIGYEHTFVHTLADFINAVTTGKAVQPTFEDGMKNQRVLEAVEESANSRQWVTI